MLALKASFMYSMPFRLPGTKNSPKRSSQEPHRMRPAVPSSEPPNLKRENVFYVQFAWESRVPALFLRRF